MKQESDGARLTSTGCAPLVIAVHFGDQVAKIIEQMVLVSEVSQLSIRCARKDSEQERPSELFDEIRPFAMEEYSVDENSEETSLGSPRRGSPGRGSPDRGKAARKVIDERQNEVFSGTLTRSQKNRINLLLGE